MLTILHGADFHLDSPFSGLSPARAAQRRREQRELLDRLVQLAQDRRADLVLLSGDLFDSQRVYPETVQALLRCLGQLPCPVFLAPGNHDFCTPGSVYAAVDWPANVHVFSGEAITAVDLPEQGCTVYGRAFTGPHLAQSPLAGFHLPPAEDGRLRLMCLHGDVTGHGDYGPITPEDIAATGLDYLALGHIHRFDGLHREGDTYWAYPGCPEGRGFDETGERGVLCLTAAPGSVQAEFVPLARRRYEALTVDLTGAEDPLIPLRAALPADAGEHIFRLTLTGQCAAPDLPRLEQALAPACYGLTLIDRTRLPLDLWSRRGEDSLTGLFLQLLWEQCQRDPENATLQLAARFGLAALENREDAAL